MTNMAWKKNERPTTITTITILPEVASKVKVITFRSRLMRFTGDISPEELFNIFFGGGYPSGMKRCYCLYGQPKQYKISYSFKEKYTVYLHNFLRLLRLMKIVLVVK